MKKKSFLTSVAVLAASMMIDASAALTDQLGVQPAYSAQAQESAKTAQDPFVLERPNSTGNPILAEHYSHRSHASHSSHTSSRY